MYGARTKPFVSRKLGHVSKFIQYLEKRDFSKATLSSNNATDVSTNQMTSTHLMLRFA